MGSPPKHLVFVGGGHAHLYALARTKAYRARDIQVTLIAPGPFWYSGMGPGLLSGFYDEADDTVDLRRLVERQDGRFIEDWVTEIRPDENQVLTGGGETIGYDALSLNVGSTVPEDFGTGDTRNGPVYTVKPVKYFLDLRKRIQSDEPPRGAMTKVAVIGSGAAGCEAAANAVALLRNLGRESEIHLVSKTIRLLEDFPEPAGEMMHRWLCTHGVRLTLGLAVTAIADQKIVLEDRSSISFDYALVAVGVRPPPLIRASAIRTSDDGAMVVNQALQSLSHPNIFGGGDCVRLQGHPLVRVGVYAVRQGPILFQNLMDYLTDGPLHWFRPQQHYLLILNCGDGTGLLAWRGYVFRNRLAFRFKDYLDRRFMARFQRAAGQVG